MITKQGCGREFESKIKGYFERCGFEGNLCPSCQSKEVKK